MMVSAMKTKHKMDKYPLVPEDIGLEIKQRRSVTWLKCFLVLSIFLVTVGALSVIVFLTPVGQMLRDKCKVDVYFVIFGTDNANTLDLPVDSTWSSLENLVAEGNDVIKQSLTQCSNPPPEGKRFDCLPEAHAAPPVACQAKGCCWLPAKQDGAPWCFFPQNYTNYFTTKSMPTKLGSQTSLQLTGTKPFWPNTSAHLQVDVRYETMSRLHFQVFDPHVDRYRVPIETPTSSVQTLKTNYVVSIQKNPFAIKVTRNGTNKVLFDSSVAPLLFADQFIQISTSVGSKYLYGFGEHRAPFTWNTTFFQQMSFWARDQPPTVGDNLYASHPFFMGLDDEGNAFGVFLLNSNAMEVIIQPAPAVTYRTIGGILDFYIFTGPTPALVIQQYLDVIGYPALPPYWSLGFHLCRWGYGGSDGMKKVIKRMRDAGFPYDTQWNDIDYMKNHLDWTYDKQKFSDLPEIVKDLHDAGQHYVMIVDPGISNTQPTGSYPPYDDGLAQGVFITEDDGKTPLVGKVWPGYTVYPDFFNPTTAEYWYNCAKSFYDQVPFDGLWTDMNEPSNFVVGSKTGCPRNRLNNPPYTPKILDWYNGGLSAKTICPSAKQHVSSHYNLHSLYGHSEAVVTRRALEKIRNKRPLVITRSSFPSTGKYVGHWTGDNNADWNNLYWSIPGILNFQMFGIPLVGADICGFGGETTEELCTRWMQLGAFYPFMRNHNTLGAKDQDPAVFSADAQKSMKTALMVRYSMLPFLYSLFMRSAMNATMVARPLFFNYPHDANTHTIDRQFMWGSHLLISPVLEKGKKEVSAYFPADIWYDFYSGEMFTSKGETKTLDAPLEVINVHVRAGAILPTQPPKNTTVFQRLQPFGLLAALDGSGKASGELFWDDGDALDTIEKKIFSHFGFTVSKSTLTSMPLRLGYTPSTGLLLGNCRIMGVSKQPSAVTVNGHPIKTFKFLPQNVLDITGLHLDLTQSVSIQWT